MTTIKTKVKLGKEYVDSTTGFIGIAVCLAKWQHGCLRVTLQPLARDDGTLPEAQTFDDLQLVGIKAGKIKGEGGPRPSPIRKVMPSR